MPHPSSFEGWDSAPTACDLSLTPAAPSTVVAPMILSPTHSQQTRMYGAPGTRRRNYEGLAWPMSVTAEAVALADGFFGGSPYITCAAGSFLQQEDTLACWSSKKM